MPSSSLEVSGGASASATFNAPKKEGACLWHAPRRPTDSSLKNETHWDAPEGSVEKTPDFIVPQSGLKTRSLGHGRTQIAVPLLRDDRLGMAAQSNDIIKVKKLIKKGADPNVKNPESGITPIGIAAERGHNEIVKLLIAAKALVNVATVDGLTPLHITCQFGMVETARLLIDAQAEVNTLSAKHVPCGTTPLGSATVRNSLPTIQLLLDSHADVNLFAEASSGNALHLACWMGHADALKMLLDTNEANVALRNGHGEMPLETALTQSAGAGHIECSQLLRPLNALAYAPPFEDQSTAELADMMGDMQVRLIRAAREQTNDDPIAMPVDLVVALLRSAAAAGDLARIKMTMTSGMFEGMFDEPSMIDRPDSSGLSALHHACAGGHLGAAACLISKGANVNAVSDEGSTALTIARAAGHPLLVQMLLKSGATEHTAPPPAIGESSAVDLM